MSCAVPAPKTLRRARVLMSGDAIFKKGSVFAAARVAWSDGVKAGLYFYRELPDEDLLPGVRLSV